jgi:hypothetical protein
MSRKTMLVILSAFFMVMTLTFTVAIAQPPPTSGSTLPYSAQLAHLEGQAVADGPYDFIFTLYASEKGDDALWTEMQSGVEVKLGNLNVVLGQKHPPLRGPGRTPGRVVVGQRARAAG